MTYWRIRFPDLNGALREREEAQGFTSVNAADRFEADVWQRVARMDAPRDIRLLYADRVLDAARQADGLSHHHRFDGYPRQNDPAFERDDLFAINNDVRELKVARGLLADKTETLADFSHYDAGGDDEARHFNAYVAGMENASLTQVRLAVLVGRVDLDGHAHDMAVVYPTNLEAAERGVPSEYAAVPVDTVMAKMLVAEAGRWRLGVDIAYDGQVTADRFDPILKRLEEGLDLTNEVRGHDSTFPAWDSYTAAAREVLQGKAEWAYDAMDRIAQVAYSRDLDAGVTYIGTIVARNDEDHDLFMLREPIDRLNAPAASDERQAIVQAIPGRLFDPDRDGAYRGEPQRGQRVAVTIGAQRAFVEVRELGEPSRALTLNADRDLEHNLAGLGLTDALEMTEA